MSPDARVRAITPAHLWWCLAGVGSALAPHALRFDPLIIAAFVLLAAWRVAGAYGRLPLPDRRHRVLWLLKQLLALAAFVAIYIAYHGQIGRDAGVSLLTALLGLKLLELDEARDFYIASFLAYFLVVTNFLYTQTVPTALYMLGVVVLVTAGLVRFNVAPEVLGARACGRLALRLVGQAMPIMVVGFLLFPRVSGPLWGLPKDAFSAVTGLSDEMSIGHITSLGTSDEVAFRVKFDGPVPRASDRYWRGPVLWETDGRRWKTSPFARDPPHPVRPRGPHYRYTMMLEPTNERWLLGLDAVTGGDDFARLGADQSLRALHPVRKRVGYTLTSVTRYTMGTLTPAERGLALQLPPAHHPRARALAAGWRARNPDAAAIVRRALAYYREEPFAYTLLPPALPGDPIDEFLFDTRAGFCEHFAASFVVLMRAAGIPARVVTGYQGGEFNDFSDYLVIRQRDAHAWAEVHLPGQGWTRVDPTSAVAPSRVSAGMEGVTDARTGLRMLDEDAAALRMWRGAAALWDAVNFQWSQWVLGYTPKRQGEFFASLGLEDIGLDDMALAMAASVAGILALVAQRMLRRRPPRDPWLRSYDAFCRKLARAGLPRAPHEGPLAYAARTRAARPDLAAAIDHITRLYTAARYGDLQLEPALLRRAVARFGPGRAPAVTANGVR